VPLGPQIARDVHGACVREALHVTKSCELSVVEVALLHDGTLVSDPIRGLSPGDKSLSFSAILAGVGRRASRPRTAFLPSRYYDTLVTLLEERGVARSDILASAGVAAERLRHADGLLTIDEVEALVLSATRLSRDRELALVLGRRLHLPSHGAVGMAGLTAENLDAAVRVAQRYFRLVTPLFSLEYRTNDTVAHIALHRLWALDPSVERFHIEAILGSLHAQASFLLGGMPKGVEVDLAYSFAGELPAWITEAAPSVSFERPAHELRVPRALLASPIPLADPRAHVIACRTCDELLAAMPSPDRATSDVRRVLEETGPPFTDLESVARTLGVASRTLRRRLADEGVSFREVLDDVRVMLAETWLLRGDRSITAIGIELGYTDAANFTRAFRRVRGMSPLSFQRSAGR